MVCTKEELKKRIESTPVSSNGRAMFSGELRREVVEYSSATQAETGASAKDIAAELGLNGWTLQRWHQNERKAKGTSGAEFVEVVGKKRGRPLKGSAQPPGEAFEVTCPSGFEVRVPGCFDVGALKSLLNAIEGR